MFFHFLSNELLLNDTSCPKLICNLPFKITLPCRIPSAYSILVNQIPRDWDMATIQPLRIERYQPVDRFQFSKSQSVPKLPNVSNAASFIHIILTALIPFNVQIVYVYIWLTHLNAQ